MVRRQGCLDMTSSLQRALTHNNGRSGIAFTWPAVYYLSAVIYSSGANNDPQLHKVEPYTGGPAALLCILETDWNAGAGFLILRLGLLI